MHVLGVDLSLLTLTIKWCMNVSRNGLVKPELAYNHSGCGDMTMTANLRQEDIGVRPKENLVRCNRTTVRPSSCVKMFGSSQKMMWKIADCGQDYDTTPPNCHGTGIL